ncbi:MAG: hypothetical protein QOK35_1343 [Pseudonocardiales bacterium]|nr:hypothetical protein [Pseudonocardiales bacterium]
MLAVVIALLGLAVVSLFMVALPVALLVVVGGVALVAGVGARLGHTPRRHRARGPSATPAGGDHDDSAVQPDAAASGRRWVTQWESGPPTSALSFVRGRLTVLAAEWGLTEEDVEPALLVVTELLSNAVDHARAPVQLVVEFLGDAIRVEVHDAADAPPRMQPHDPLRRRGRGMQMVETLSERWGWTDTSSGKVVWAEVVIGWPEERTAAAPGER